MCMSETEEHQNTLKVKEEIEKSTILFEDIYTPPTAIDRS